MKVLVLNQGSSSIKCCIYRLDSFPNELMSPIWSDTLEWKNGQKSSEIFRTLFSSLSFDCIGHRIVHGGQIYKHSVLIDSKVKQDIQKLSELAPLHNKSELEGIELLEKLFPNIPQIAVFDTSFHNTIPPSASIYPGPYQWFEEGIQKYGFHGISYQYCSKRAVDLLDEKIKNMVICHLGSGASLCALKMGKSIETTMGFTPLDGLMMDTRSGTIDPGLLLYLLKDRSAKQLSLELYEQSGLLGLSGISHDMRDILEQAKDGHPRAKLSLDIYLHRLVSFLGAMIACLGGIDVLVFTGGIGENSSFIRQKCCEQLSFLGIKLLEPPKISTEDAILSDSHSSVKVLLIHTQESLEIARECWAIIAEQK